MSKINLAVIGSSSMVGSRFCELASKNLNLVKADFNGDVQIDITSKESVSIFFKKNNFESLILFSAFTDVDSAESQRNNKNGSCWMVNVVGVENIVSECQKTKRNLILISTDFVFDGSNGPYSESDPPGPDMKKVSWYGITKVESEKIVKSLQNYMILRISYPYRGRFNSKDDIAKRILRMAKDNTLYPMFSDQIITPTFIDDISTAAPLIIKNRGGGIIHLASPKITTQYEFAKELLSVFNDDPDKVKKGSLVSFLNEGNTPRPQKGGLKTEKIEKLGFTPTDWKTGIKKIFDQSQGQLLQ